MMASAAAVAELDKFYYMRRCLKLARRGRGKVAPNPMVGALIIKGGKIIAEGYHHRFGYAHAEVEAINKASEKSRGATLYVNLEPCCHWGKTPPCTEYIIKAGIKRVVAAMKDSNPIVSGSGFKILKEAGIEVEVGILEDAARALNQDYIKWVTTRLPWVAVKLAMSLDGKIATSEGTSKWISGEKSRKYVQKLRQAYDAIMVGIGTVLADDPLLNIRDGDDAAAAIKQPYRIVVDSKLRLPDEAKVLDSSLGGPTIIATTSKAPAEKIDRLRKSGIQVLVLDSKEAPTVDLLRLAEELYKLNIFRVLIEGGGELCWGALKAGIVDKVYFIIAPKIIGGRAAKTPVEGEGYKSLEDALIIKHLKYRRIGTDLLIEGEVGK